MISNILITVPPSPFVNRIPCLHRRGEQSLVETLIEGLGRTVGFESASVRILTHDPPAGPSLGDRLAAELHANYRHLVQGIRALNSFELLAEIARTDATSIEDYVVFRGSSLGYNLDSAYQILKDHKSGGNDLSWAADLPAGVVPFVISRRCIEWASRLPCNFSGTFCVVTWLRELGRGMAGANIQTDQRFQACRISNKAYAQSTLLSICVEDDLSLIEDEAGPYRDLPHQAAGPAADPAPVPVPSRRAQSRGDTLKVLYVSLARAKSGAEVSFSNLVFACTQLGIDSLTAVQFGEYLSADLRRRGLRVAISGVGLGQVDFRAVTVFRRLLDEFVPDIVHVDSYDVPALLILCADRKIPVVSHVRIIPSPENCKHLKFSAKVIAISETVRHRLERVGVDASRIEVVPDGIDTGFWTSTDEQSTEGSCAIVVSARLAPMKRHELVIDAFAAISSRFPSSQVRFVGEASPGDYGYLRGLRMKVDKLGLEERIQFEGFVEDIRPILSRARVVVLASDLEPLGICLLEAACMGVLVIASRSGGPAEIFTSGQNALLFQPSDVSSLAKCLETALSLESSGYLSTIRNRGQALARQYSLETYGRRIVKVYREVSGR